MSLIDKNSLSIAPYVNQSNCQTSATAESSLYSQESLKSRREAVILDSFKAQFRDYNKFHQYGMGDIVVLVGSSTAGKTSIIQALKQIERDRLEDGGDLRGCATDLKVLAKYAPNELEILKHVFVNPLDIPLATFYGDRPWKTGITDQEITTAEAAMKRIKERVDGFSEEEKDYNRRLFENMELEMFDDVFELSRQGKNVILDAMLIDKLSSHILMRNFNGPIRIVNAFCPFHELEARMEKRNKEAVESGQLSDQRIGEFPLTQFSEIYTKKEKGQQTFEKLERKQVLDAFNTNFDRRVESDRLKGKKLPSAQQIEKDKKELLAYVLVNLGFEDGVDVVKVAPKNQHLYKVFINTSKSLPHESAAMIHQGTYKRY